MKAYETILNRRSIRKYKDKEVSDEQIKILLQAAMAAPSARNQQAWKFYVIKDKNTQLKIKNLSPYYNFNSPLLIIVAGNIKKSIRNDQFWVQDCAAATQNLLLAATELKLGSLWCGIFPKPEAVTKIKEILNLPEDIIPLSLLHIGYGEEEKEARTQYNEDNIVVL